MFMISVKKIIMTFYNYLWINNRLYMLVIFYFQHNIIFFYLYILNLWIKIRFIYNFNISSLIRGIQNNYLFFTAQNNDYLIYRRSLKFYDNITSLLSPQNVVYIFCKYKYPIKLYYFCSLLFHFKIFFIYLLF